MRPPSTKMNTMMSTPLMVPLTIAAVMSVMPIGLEGSSM